MMRHLKNYFISEQTGFYDTIKHDGSLKRRVIQKSLMSAAYGEKCVLVRTWVLAAVCWYTAWGAGRPAYAQPALARAGERLTPKAWIQQYLGVEFPNSARHFVLYYRASDQDVALFSFDIAKDDLQHLMDGRGIFPGYGDLVSGGSDLPERIVRDSGSQYFAEKMAAMKNALSASKSRTTPAEPLTVQLWTTEASAGRWAVCVCVIGEECADRAIAYSGFKMPVAPQETQSYVIIDSKLEQVPDTGVGQRWSLDEAAYQELMQIVKARTDIVRYPDGAVERILSRLTTRGFAPGTPWWNPSELKERHPGDSEPLEGFFYKGPGVISKLIIGRMDGLFRCYVYTQRHVLSPDPPDAIWRLLSLQLPTSVSDVHYESTSSMAGVVSWMRFDLPLRDFVACLAQTPVLPVYAEFAADAAVREHLHTAYQTGAPEWWRPQDLSEGIYAQRRSSAKESHDISIGLGRLPGENIRVYIGEFSAW